MRPTAPEQLAVFPTPYPKLNALAGGGFPRGRLSEIYGPEGSGKTTIVLDVIALAQRQGSLAVYIDAEHKLDWRYACSLGVDVDRLVVFRPETAEGSHALTACLLRSGLVGLLVIDSLAGLVPQQEYTDPCVADCNYGGLMGRWVRTAAVLSARSNTCVVITNQLRSKVGVMFGSPDTTPGGRVLRHQCSLRIELRPIGVIKNGDRIIGKTVRATVTKSVLGGECERAEIDLMSPTTRPSNANSLGQPQADTLNQSQASVM